METISPLWSPDSKKIAYLSPVKMKYQIFIYDLESNSHIQITSEKDGVSIFKWEPSGNGFYYTTNTKETDIIKQRREQYGDFRFIDEECELNSLCYIDSDKNVIQLINKNGFYIVDFDISNDGEKIVLLAAPSSLMRDYFMRELYCFSIKENQLRKLKCNKLLDGNVHFSPNGEKVCYTASILEKDYYKTLIQENTVDIFDIQSGEVIQPLRDYDSTVIPLRWTDKGILIKWQDKTNYRMGLLDESGTVTTIEENFEGFILDASITRDGKYVAYSKALKNETFEIYLDNKKITSESDLLVNKLMCNREIIKWESSDGTPIEGILSTPIEFDVTKKYPLLVVAHGGPAWASFPIYSDCFNEKYPIEQFVSKGFIVLEPNYRGSSGYGSEFLTANYRSLGIAYYEDIVAGLDALIAKGLVDEDRVGIMGWSNGGYVAAFCSTFSNRFKAISVGGGITNWSTHYVHTDIPYSMKMHLGDTPWNDPQVYSKTSPMSYIKSACTPTLIQHGEMDQRIPITNAYELYQGLKDMGVETKLVVFKDMAYSSSQPRIHAMIMHQNLAWFSHYLLGESLKDLKSLSFEVIS